MKDSGMPESWLASHRMTGWTVGKFREEMGRRLNAGGADVENKQAKIGIRTVDFVYMEGIAEGFSSPNPIAIHDTRGAVTMWARQIVEPPEHMNALTAGQAQPKPQSARPSSVTPPATPGRRADNGQPRSLVTAGIDDASDGPPPRPGMG
jgi:hypothetical protein